MGLGLTVGAIYSDMPPLDGSGPTCATSPTARTTNSASTTLRDNMKPAAHNDERFDPQERQVQRALTTPSSTKSINILVDEARTAADHLRPCGRRRHALRKADKIARQLKKDVHFEVKEKEHSAHLTEDGVREAEKLAGVESFYTAGNMDWPHLIDNFAEGASPLQARRQLRRRAQQGFQSGRSDIVDEFTGRLMHGRQWSDGLHQACEAKEGVPIKKETQTYATVTLQNFFKMYKKISGMTGTAMTEANELWKIYKLDVIAIPTNKPSIRANSADVIYRTEREKFEAICDEIESLHKWDQIDLKEGETQFGTILREEGSDGRLPAEGIEGQANDHPLEDRRDSPQRPADPRRHGEH